MRKLIITAAVAGCVAISLSTTARANIHFANSSSDALVFTLQCPHTTAEDEWWLRPGQIKDIYCPRSDSAYFRVRTTRPDGSEKLVHGWVQDGELVRLFRDRRGDVKAVVE